MLSRRFHHRPFSPPRRHGVGALGWTSNDYRALIKTADDLGMRPADLMLVMYSESGLNPAAKNPAGAYGLIQWTRATGLSEDELEGLLSKSPAEQMPYVKRYFTGVAPSKSSYGDAGEVYAYVFLPARADMRGVADDSVLTRSPEGYYTQNSILDFNKDGEITVKDLRDHLRALSTKSGYERSLEDMRKVGDVSGPVTSYSGSNKIKTILSVGVVGVVGYTWYRFLGGKAIVGRYTP